MARYNRYSFTVVGNLSFPTDMLRHDACFPANSDAAAEIEASIRRVPGERRNYSVQLLSVGEAPPTSARWASFNWHVVPESIVGYKL